METEVWRLDQPGFSSDIRSCLLDADSQEPLKRLVVGNLRSYGDQVLCPAGLCIQTTRCDRVLAIDASAGKVIVESGITIDSLQRWLDPLGLMLPVTPGTSLLTVGGAIANDIHGKNHHVAGTFGCYVDWLELVRTSGEVLRCSESQNAGLFSATIGGMGLTGAITLTCLKVRPVDSPYLDVEAQKFANLDQFFEIDDANQNGYEYSVAWIDCLATGRALGRGVYSKANSVSLPMPPRSGPLIAPTRRANMPFTLPLSPVNRLTLSLMNTVYWNAHWTGKRRLHYKRWLYPLDSIHQWNRLYGKRGFRQFQCAVPRDHGPTAIREMLNLISSRRRGSFLAVLKNFGDKPSPGLMSFPMPGTTLALDFPYRGTVTDDLLLALHRIAIDAGGRIYPAKDACSPVNSLEISYPNFVAFKTCIDPGIGSALARRLQLTA